MRLFRKSFFSLEFEYPVRKSFLRLSSNSIELNADSSTPVAAPTKGTPAATSPVESETSPVEPRVVPRSQHRISRKNISEETLKVLYRLSSLGFKGYLVGGGVRDLYLGKAPKDYDVGTDAKPSRLKRIFRNCRIIGRRFRIAHVFFPGDKIIEVATFRRGEVHRIDKGTGVILIDNEYGTPEEDARRRDLTINGLFYDITTHSIIDYVGGVEDLDRRIIRTINDPDKSFVEDPVRMIRTLRHAARTEFTIEENTLKAIYRRREEISKANPSRLLEEFFKDLRSGAMEPYLRKITETHLLDVILPALSNQLRDHGLDHPLWRRLSVLDSWAREGRDPANPTLLAILLHTVLLPDPALWKGENNHPPDVWRLVMQNFSKNLQHIRISRKDAERVTQILIAFRKLTQAHNRQFLPPSLQKKPYLTEALDFLELDLTTRNDSCNLIEEWRKKYQRNLPPRPRQNAFGAGGFINGQRGEKRSGRRKKREGTKKPGGAAAGEALKSPEQKSPAQRSQGQKSPGETEGADTGVKKRRRRRRRGGRRHKSTGQKSE